MNLSPHFARALPASCLLACLALVYGLPQPARSGGQMPVTPEQKAPSSFDTSITETARANELIRRQPGFFVPNLGQWDHGARFVHRSGPMTLFLEDRGWVIDLVERPVERMARPYEAGPQEVRSHEPGSSAGHRAVSGESKVDQKLRGVALQMTFEGDGHVPAIVGENRFAGHHNYFLGQDESRWRTGVPLYGSVRYESLYPGIDLRLRQEKGVPEYDLLLQPGADLSRVTVQVEGAEALRISKNGSLVIETVLGPLIQPLPKTWQVGADGSRQEVACEYILLSSERFAFEVPGWDGSTHLTIDPGLTWSTFLGGSKWDGATALSVDTGGVVTVAGYTRSPNFPTTSGAYNTTRNGLHDAFISRLDMGIAFYADRYELSLKQPGTQQELTLNAGKAHAGKLYWIFGSFTGTKPGITLGGVHIPLNPDAYTNVVMANTNTAVYANFLGRLDGNGAGLAYANIPSGLPASVSFTVYHAYLVYGATGKFYMASNAVPLVLK